jgi:hypothetical protein
MFEIHKALFVACAAAVLACAGLSVPLIATSEPEPCCAGPVADPRSLPSPTATPQDTRQPGLPHCLVGSWVVTAEQRMFKFYTDVDPLPLTFGGGVRYYEFHPDGTAIDRVVNFTMVGSHRGQEIRTVSNGERHFTWSATNNTITYHALTATSLVVDFYDQRGRLIPSSETPDPNFNETDNISCAATQAVESTTREGSNYRGDWTRTADYGVYG